MRKKERIFSNFDLPLLISVLAIMAVGMTTIYSVTFVPDHSSFFDECDWIIEGRELQADNVRILVLWLVNGNNSRWTIGERMVEGGDQRRTKGVLVVDECEWIIKGCD